jgi:ABC-type Fe3+-hydroxamate transport system substrate-binding protein
MTDSFLTLGLGRFLVGVTDFCEWRGDTAQIVRVGGVKDARREDIEALNPDLVILNEEENSPDLAAALAAAGIRIWLTFPRTVRQAMDDLREIALAYPEDGLLPRIDWLERSVEWMEKAETPDRVRVFCPIWREGDAADPSEWMTFSEDTYAEDLLMLCGGENVFSSKTSSRYPRITREDIRKAMPEVILLPNEPFEFREQDAEALRKIFPDLPAVLNGRVIRMDGRLLFWHGTKLGESICVLPDALQVKPVQPDS